MQRSSPRARGGLRRLAASSPSGPSRPPPTRASSSSTNTMTSGWARASAITPCTRSSKAARSSVPPRRAPMLSSTMRLPASTAGSRPSAARIAIASTIAVLPTPASPTRTGLFRLLRASAWRTARISRPRPMIGPSSPLRASAVRSRPKRSRVGVREGASARAGGVASAGAAAASAGTAASRAERSWATSTPPCRTSRAVTTSTSSARAAKRWATPTGRSSPARVSAAAKTALQVSDRESGPEGGPSTGPLPSCARARRRRRVGSRPEAVTAATSRAFSSRT